MITCAALPEAAPVIFVPGASSYQEVAPNGEMSTVLSEASARRARVAVGLAATFPDSAVVFSGGYPGKDIHSKDWPKGPDGEPRLPLRYDREASLMATPLREALGAVSITKLSDTTAQSAEGRVRIQVGSSDSMGDVIEAVSANFLSPEEFADQPDKGVIVAAGSQHFLRFKDTLSIALGIDPSRVRRASNVIDPHGMPGRHSRSLLAELLQWRASVYKEDVALVLHRAALHIVRPSAGSIEALEQARLKFLDMANHPVRALLRHPLVLGRSALQTLFFFRKRNVNTKLWWLPKPK